ncbi:hypothetical protein HUO09_07980 [Vibrio sp. Y2-5]|uniref:hypothetical protein n=1 Tax=Vibrio sp. Y2-5 TaxID=2743977 RepID=UPI0016602289|nr:hypothetical protein [Vibrio sp. Y2-5]MBD0786281.1 hypothetical protein [Vibrio sp. Y2-5]
MLKLILLALALVWLVLRQKTKDNPEKTKTIKCRRLLGYSLTMSIIWIIIKGFGIPQNQIHVEAAYKINNGSTQVLFGYSENRLIPALHAPRFYTYNFADIYKVHESDRKALREKHPYVTDPQIWVNYFGGMLIFLLLTSWFTRSLKLDGKWAEALEADQKKSYLEFEEWAEANKVRKLHSFKLLRESEERRKRLDVVSAQKLAIVTKAIKARGIDPAIFSGLQKVKEAGLSTLYVVAEHLTRGENESVVMKYGAVYPEEFEKQLLEIAKRDAQKKADGTNTDTKLDIVLRTARENLYIFPTSALQIFSRETFRQVQSLAKLVVGEDYLAVKESDALTDTITKQQAVLHVQYVCSLESDEFKDLSDAPYPVGYRFEDSKSQLTKVFNGKKVSRTPISAFYFGVKAHWKLMIKGEVVDCGDIRSIPDPGIADYAFPSVKSFEGESLLDAREKYFTSIARTNISSLVSQIQGKPAKKDISAAIDKAKYHKYKAKANETKKLLKELEDALRDEIKSETQYEAASILTQKIYEKYKDEIDALAFSIIDNDVDPEMTLFILDELAELFPELGEYVSGLGVEVFSD